MRKTALLALAAALFAASGAFADEATRQTVARYFTGWYSVCPGNKVTAVEAGEVAIPGFEAYRTERSCALKNRNESNIALVDDARKEIFVGQVLHDDSRKNQPFAAETDLPNIRGALQQDFGLPVAISVKGSPRGALVPIAVRIQQAPGAVATLPGFVSQDGASVLLGEFFPLDVPPEVTRARILAEAPPAAPAGKKPIFTVTAFIDFQCEKCRVRAPQVRDYAWTHGGAFETRFLPLVKIHEWSFAAAESAAALRAVSPPLLDNYERQVFAAASGMNAKGARDLAGDIAEAAGVRQAFDAEIASGRARDRVVADIDLALRLGLNGTPVFFFRGAWLTSEPDLAERFIESRLSEPAKPAAKSPAP
ncbi:MAG TPA: DsbA family protein [Thermoanaerobaculia bacterium]|nr:DsbA family protein [Thermoanaerobaculia bacterium]